MCSGRERLRQRLMSMYDISDIQRHDRNYRILEKEVQLLRFISPVR